MSVFKANPQKLKAKSPAKTNKIVISRFSKIARPQRFKGVF